jgi:hypothetical protein
MTPPPHLLHLLLHLPLLALPGQVDVEEAQYGVKYASTCEVCKVSEVQGWQR